MERRNGISIEKKVVVGCITNSSVEMESKQEYFEAEQKGQTKLTNIAI